jgi:hypothetical protein
MATFPLATLACTIDENGISAPSYADVLASLQASFQSIYGSDIYIEPDSQDGQWLAVLAQIINDGNQADVTSYNGYSPSYAQGAALSSQVKINGLRRDCVEQQHRCRNAGRTGRNADQQWRCTGHEQEPMEPARVRDDPCQRHH